MGADLGGPGPPLQSDHSKDWKHGPGASATSGSSTVEGDGGHLGCSHLAWGQPGRLPEHVPQPWPQWPTAQQGRLHWPCQEGLKVTPCACAALVALFINLGGPIPGTEMSRHNGA